MQLITVVDDNYGMTFNNRRQSRDSELIEKIMDFVGDDKLYMTNYSAQLFTEYHDSIKVYESVIISDVENMPENTTFFVESPAILKQPGFVCPDVIVLYHWNRLYPSDVVFPKELLQEYKLDTITYFKGSSHDNITEEIWRKKR